MWPIIAVIGMAIAIACWTPIVAALFLVGRFFKVLVGRDVFFGPTGLFTVRPIVGPLCDRCARPMPCEKHSDGKLDPKEPDNQIERGS